MAHTPRSIYSSFFLTWAAILSFCGILGTAKVAASGFGEIIGNRNELELYEAGAHMDGEDGEPPALVGNDEELADSNFPFIAGNDGEKDQEFNIKTFHSKFFWTRPKKPYYMVDVGINSTSPNDGKTLDGQKIMAFGFVDNDKFNDIVVTNSEMNTIQVHFFDNTDSLYTPSASFKVDEESPNA